MSNKRPIESNDLFKLRLVADPQISPNGELVAFVVETIDEEKNDYISNIYVTDREGQVRQFTSGDRDSTPRCLRTRPPIAGPVITVIIRDAAIVL